MLEGARLAGAEQVVFAASGGTLYGEPDAADLPVQESHPQRPLSPYGVSKKAAIDYLVAYRELHSLEFSALALANVYGPRQDPHGEAGVVAIFAERLLAGEPVTIFGDGEQTRDFVFVDDVVDAFVAGGHQGRRAGLQHRHRAGDLGQRALPRHGRRRLVSDADAAQPRCGQGELLRSSLDPEQRRHPPGLEALDHLADGTRAVLDFVRQRLADEA